MLMSFDSLAILTKFYISRLELKFLHCSTLIYVVVTYYMVDFY